jgi:hypothetical protein
VVDSDTTSSYLAGYMHEADPFGQAYEGPLLARTARSHELKPNTTAVTTVNSRCSFVSSNGPSELNDPCFLKWAKATTYLLWSYFVQHCEFTLGFVSKSWAIFNLAWSGSNSF